MKARKTLLTLMATTVVFVFCCLWSNLQAENYEQPNFELTNCTKQGTWPSSGYSGNLLFYFTADGNSKLWKISYGAFGTAGSFTTTHVILGGNSAASGNSKIETAPYPGLDATIKNYAVYLDMQWDIKNIDTAAFTVNGGDRAYKVQLFVKEKDATEYVSVGDEVSVAKDATVTVKDIAHREEARYFLFAYADGMTSNGNMRFHMLGVKFSEKAADPTEITLDVASGSTNPMPALWSAGSQSVTLDLLGTNITDAGVAITTAYNENGKFAVNPTTVSKSDAEDGTTITVTYTYNADLAGKDSVKVYATSNGVTDSVVIYAESKFCGAPTLTVANKDKTTANITVTNAVEYCIWQYKGDDWSSEDYVTDDAISLTSLTAGTEYTVRAKNECVSSTVYSEYTTLTFTTTADDQKTLNFETDFTAGKEFTGQVSIPFTTDATLGTNNGEFQVKVEITGAETKTENVTTSPYEAWLKSGNYSVTLTLVDHEGTAVTPTVTTGARAFSVDLPDVGAITFNPAAGTINEVKTVTIECATAGAAIQYKTAEGDEWADYTAGTTTITINKTNTTVYAKATLTNYDDATASATYILQVPAPTITPAEAAQTDSVKVKIECTDADAIYYAIDGDVAEDDAHKYAAEFWVKGVGSHTVKAIATKADWTNSEVAEQAYTIAKGAEPMPTGCVFRENFEKCLYKDWNGPEVTDTLDKVTDNAGWKGVKVYKGLGGLKMGGGSAFGYVTSPEIPLTTAVDGKYYVSFLVGTWTKTGEVDKIYVISGEDTVTVKDLPQVATGSRTGLSFRTVQFTNGTQDRKITFSATTKDNNRFFLDSVLVFTVKPEGFTTASITAPATVTLPAYNDGESTSVKVAVKGADLTADVAVAVKDAKAGWAVTPASLTAATVMGEKGDTITITYNGTALTDNAEITLTSGEATATVNASVSKNLPTVGEITFTPAPGKFTDSVWVKMTCATEGATIYYTTNGIDPTTINGTVFADSVKVTVTTNFKARGIKADHFDGPVASATYKRSTGTEITFNRITDPAEFLEGDKVLIVCGQNSKAMSTKVDGKRIQGTDVEIDGNGSFVDVEAVATAMDEDKPCQFTLVANPNGEGFAFQFGDKYIKGETGETYCDFADQPSYFTLTSDNNNGMVIAYNVSGGRMIRGYSGGDFRQYLTTSTSGYPVQIYLGEHGVPSTDPSLTVAASVDLKYNEGENGTATLTVKGKNLEQDVTVAVKDTKAGFAATPATLTKEDVMGENGATVTVTYSGTNEKDTAEIILTYGTDLTKTVKVFVKRNASISTIKDLWSLYSDNIDKTAVYTLKKDIVVTQVDSAKNVKVWAQDIDKADGGSINIYVGTQNDNRALKVGDVLTGVTGKLDIFNGLLELIPTAAFTVKSQNHDVYIDTISVADANTRTYQSALVCLKDVTVGATNDTAFKTYTEYTLVDDDARSILFYINLANADYVGKKIPAKKLNVVGILNEGNVNKVQKVYFTPRTWADFTEVDEALPLLTVQPVIAPEEAVHMDSVEVTITCDSTRAAIYYTTDGTAPGKTSTLYEGAFKLYKSATVKAVALLEGYRPSAVTTKAYTVKRTVEPVNPVGDVVFEENFSKSDNAWDYSTDESGDLSAFTDETGWTGTFVYPTKSSVKCGKSSGLGSITSREIDLSYNGGVFYVSFKAMAWLNDATEFLLIAGNDTVTVDELNNGGSYDEAYKDYAFKFEHGTANTQLTFTATKASKNRFFIDAIKVQQELPAVPMFIGLPDEVAISYVQGQSVGKEVTVKGKNLDEDVTVTIAGEGFTVAPATLAKADVTGENGAKLTVTYSGASDTSAKATVTVKSGDLTKTIEVTATALPGAATLEALYDFYDDVKNGTIGKNDVYVVTGDLVVTFKNNYNVYLQDAGMTDEEGASIMVYNARNYGYDDLAVGDVIGGLKGTLTVYHGLFEVNPKEKMETKSHDHAIHVCEVPMSYLTTDDGLNVYYQSSIVTLKNVSFVDGEVEEDAVYNAKDSLKITDGTDVMYFYCGLTDVDYLGTDVKDSAMNLTGIVAWYDTKIQIMPRNLEDIEIIRSENPNVDNEEATRVDFAVYPNPAAGKFYVTVADALVEVYNASGVRVAAKQVNGQAEFNLNTSGVYFVKVANTVKRVIVR